METVEVNSLYAYIQAKCVYEKAYVVCVQLWVCVHRLHGRIKSDQDTQFRKQYTV